MEDSLFARRWGRPRKFIFKTIKEDLTYYWFHVWTT